MNAWESHRVMSMEVACCPRTSWRAASSVLIGLNHESVTHLSCALECSTECKILIMLIRVSWDFVQTYLPLKLCNWWIRDRSSSSRWGDRFAVTNNFEDAVLQDGGGKHAFIGSWTKSSKTIVPSWAPDPLLTDCEIGFSSGVQSWPVFEPSVRPSFSLSWIFQNKGTKREGPEVKLGGSYPFRKKQITATGHEDEVTLVEAHRHVTTHFAVAQKWL